MNWLTYVSVNLIPLVKVKRGFQDVCIVLVLIWTFSVILAMAMFCRLLTDWANISTTVEHIYEFWMPQWGFPAVVENIKKICEFVWELLLSPIDISLNKIIFLSWNLLLCKCWTPICTHQSYLWHKLQIFIWLFLIFLITQKTLFVLIPLVVLGVSYVLNQGSLNNSFALFRSSGSHWSIFLANTRNCLRSSPLTEATEFTNVYPLGMRSLLLDFPRS